MARSALTAVRLGQKISSVAAPFNSSQEMSGLDAGFRRRTAKVLKDWHDAIAKGLREGQKRGVVRNGINANETATFLIAAYEGYVVLTKNLQDARTMQSGQRRVSGHLESLRPARGRRRVQAADRRPFVEPHDRESGGQAYWAGEVGRVRRSGAVSESYLSPFTK
jgi:hypothetical protein